MSIKYIIVSIIGVFALSFILLNGYGQGLDLNSNNLNSENKTSSVDSKVTSEVKNGDTTTSKSSTATSTSNKNDVSVKGGTSNTENTTTDPIKPTNPKISVGIVKPDTGGLKEKLIANEWYWIKTERGIRPITPDTKIVEPKNKTDFTLTFSNDGKINIDTDCNSMSGTYTLKGTNLGFGPMMSTLMYCENSVESEFSKSIKSGTTYYLSFDSTGNNMYIVSNETMYFVKK